MDQNRKSVEGGTRTFVPQYIDAVTKPFRFKIVDVLLFTNGFTRRRYTWSRTRGPFTDVVDLQRSKSFDKVTVNVGIMHADTYELVWGAPPNDPPSEPDCIVRERIGSLLNGKDQWWPLGDLAPIEEIADAIEASALPFLDGVRDLSDMERQLRLSKRIYPPEPLYLAAVQHLQCNDEEARATVQQLLGRTKGPWKDKVLSMAAFLT